MANGPTQDECERRFKIALDKFIRELYLIDDETPANPVTEPDWWINMNSLRRHLVKIQQQECNNDHL